VKLNLINNRDFLKSFIFLKYFIILIFLFFLTSTLVYSENNLDNNNLNNINLDDIIKESQNLLLQLDFDYGFELNKKGSNPEVKSVEVSLSLFPREDNIQSLISFNTFPESKLIEDDYLKHIYFWDNPSLGTYNYGYNSIVKTKSYFVSFDQKPNFPIKIIDETLLKYTKPSEHIDSNNLLIKNKASQIVEGETDLFLAVYKIGMWVKENVDYDLNTLTADVSQKSSWVLENQYGVCDEITNLFIGMLRSIGIPAKFVSGLSYTNVGTYANDWGMHGWAEVYFPNVGWVPFDITYGQFGYIDASHIKLRSADDVGYSSVEYTWFSNDVSFKSLKNNYKVTLLNSEGNFNEPIIINAFPVKNEVSFGSYNLVEVNIINENPHYIPIKLFISKTEGIELLDEHIHELLLLPYENSTLFFKFKVSDDLNSNYVYTFPIQFHTSNNNEALLSFSSKKYSPFYSLEEFETYENIRLLTKQENPLIDLNCSTQDYFYTTDEIYFLCNVTNRGNVIFNNLSICLDDCFDFELLISELKEFKLHLQNTSVGDFEKLIYITGDAHSSIEENIIIYDIPKLDITQLKFLSEIEYGIEFPISFSITKNSFSNLKNIVVTLTNSLNEKTWLINSIDEEHDFIVNIHSADLQKNNLFTIHVKYEDLNGNLYFTQTDFEINLINLTFKQKSILLINKIIVFIDNYIILSSIIIALITFLIISLIVNKSKIKLSEEKKRIEKENFIELIKDSEKQEKEDEKFFKD
jgi:hypothetical protein